jgi:hypothetical protein
MSESNWLPRIEGDQCDGVVGLGERGEARLGDCKGGLDEKSSASRLESSPLDVLWGAVFSGFEGFCHSEGFFHLSFNLKSNLCTPAESRFHVRPNFSYTEKRYYIRRHGLGKGNSCLEAVREF